jgi:hypothetical protein
MTNDEGLIGVTLSLARDPNPRVGLGNFSERPKPNTQNPASSISAAPGQT